MIWPRSNEKEAAVIAHGDEHNPLVSVIIPVHNGEKFLLEAVASVRAQQYPSLELVIVDDGSTDGTTRMIAEMGHAVQVVHQARRGPAAARNRGIELSHGGLVAFLDCDDLWPAGKLRAQVAYLCEHPALDLVLGRIQLVYAARESSSPLLQEPQSVIDVQLGSAVFRRSAFTRFGCFDPELTFSEDYDWFLRAREQHVRLAILDRVTLLHRRHAGNMTRDEAHRGYQLTRVLKASLERRRAAGTGIIAPLPRLLAWESNLPPSSSDCDGQ